MQTILQSGFLQNLAGALLNSFWQMGLLWLAVILILKIFRLTSAQKFNFAFIAQVSGFAFFTYDLFADSSTEKSSSYIHSNQSIYINTLSDYIQAAMPVVAVIYILMLIWKVAKMFTDYRLTQQLRTDDIKKASAANRIFVKEMSSLFSIKRKVEIYFSSTINCPLTFGFLKPLILLPVAIINNLTKEQTEAIILHELAHIKRADYLLYLIQCFINKVFFFNIFSKLLSNIIERERENACDDWVIQFKYNTYHYAEALLKLGKLQTTSFAMAASGKTQNVLLPRIKRLLHDEEKTFNYSISFFVFNALTMFFVLLLILLISFKNQKTKNVISAALQTTFPAQIVNKPLAAFQYLSTVKKESEINNSFNKDVAHADLKPSIKSTAKKYLKTYKEPPQQQLAKVPGENIPYIVNVRQLIDSFRLAQTTVTAAVNTKIELDSMALQQAVSYQNFKQLETMLALAGNNINVTEDKRSRNDYKKLITIETTDKYGNKHVYKLVVELYQ